MTEATAETSQLAEPTSPGLFRPKIWLVDAFCFTPWYSAALVDALGRAGAQVRFVASSISREPDYFSRHGLQTNPGPYRFDQLADSWHPSVRRALRCLAALSNSAALRHSLGRDPEQCPDVIHLQQIPLLNYGMKADLKFILAAQKRGIPVVHTVHNLLPHDSGDSLRNAYKRIYSTVDRLICHSPDIAEKLVSRFSIRETSISVVPHGPLFEDQSKLSHSQAEARGVLKIDPLRPVVLWQGIMAPYKGLDVLRQAWALCTLWWKRQDVKPLLLVAGTGPASEEAAVLAMAGELSQTVRADVRYIPTVELPFYYRAADVLVYPYRAITTSGALLTGLSYRKPIIASDLLPFRQYLRDRDNALLVSPGNAGELAEVLYQLICEATQPAKSQLYKTLLAGAASNRERYSSWDAIAQQTLAAYHLAGR